MTSSKVAPGSRFYPTDPVSATEGAVSSWFSLAHPSSVITGAGYSNVHDLLNSSSPATQSTDARRPPGATSNNGLPIITCSSSVMTFPVIAARTNQSTWGFWAWAKVTANGSNIQSFATVGGASANRSYLFFDGGSGQNMRADIFDGASTRISFVATTPSVWNFLTYEYNASKSGDARFICSVNGAVQTLAYLGALSEEPPELEAVTGTGTLFAFTTAAVSPFVGSIGTNFGFFDRAMSGSTVGLLTTAARLALMNYQRPT